jgi:hypothetical protein
MLDFIKTILVIVVIIGLWFAAPVFGAIVGTGLALVFLHFILKEYKEEMENDRES